MKQLLYFNDIFEAEVIVRTDNAIFGITNGVEMFSFKGISDFTIFKLAEGQEFDVPEQSVEEKLRLEMARSNAEMFEMMVSMLGGEM